MKRHVLGTLVAGLALVVALSSSCVSQGDAAKVVGSGPESGIGLMNLDVRPGAGVTKVSMLSDYAPSLFASPGDSHVYILDSGVAGGTLLVVGGTHANELAGMTAATLLVERAMPKKGRLIVIPHLNSSGLGYADSSNPQPSWIRVDAASGTRYLRYGARLVHPSHQGRPDSERYILPDSTATLAGQEQRNINRAYPGIEDGPLAQRIAWAVMEIINREHVGIALDMHEARPTSKLKWMIVSNPKNLDIAVNSIFDLEDKDILLNIDQSSNEFRGLSHKEWGDRTSAMAFLLETVNPAQLPMGGVAVDHLHHPEYPLWKRVAVQLEALGALVYNYNAVSKADDIMYDGVPSYDALESLGLEEFL